MENVALIHGVVWSIMLLGALTFVIVSDWRYQTGRTQRAVDADNTWARYAHDSSWYGSRAYVARRAR